MHAINDLESTERPLDQSPFEAAVDVKAAARFLGVSPSLVYAYVERKQIPHFRMMGRSFGSALPNSKSGGDNSSSMEESMSKGRPRTTGETLYRRPNSALWWVRYRNREGRLVQRIHRNHRRAASRALSAQAGRCRAAAARIRRRRPRGARAEPPIDSSMRRRLRRRTGRRASHAR